MKKLECLMALMIVGMGSAALACASLPPVTTAASVDLTQYEGKWYEFAAIPQGFESQCVGNTTAEYASVSPNEISVTNTCDTASGVPSVANGRAEIVDTNSNAKLKVTFVNLFGGWIYAFGGDYWILQVGDHYSYAVVGAPGRDYAWILSRTPDLSQDHLNEANAVLVSQGFDSCKLLTTVQAGGSTSQQPLCHLVTGK